MLQIILGILSTLLALLFLGAGVIAVVGAAQQDRRCSARAKGTVTGILTEERPGKNHTTTVYRPVFEYTVDGQTHTLQSPFPSLKKQFALGAKVTVRHDPADPGVAFIQDDPQNSSQGSVMLLCIGILFVVGAVAAFTAL